MHFVSDCLLNIYYVSIIILQTYNYSFKIKLVLIQSEREWKRERDRESVCVPIGCSTALKSTTAMGQSRELSTQFT